MNRAQRREDARRMARMGAAVAEAVCERCGAPICPTCQLEASECPCCGQFACDGCGIYVVAPLVADLAVRL